MCSKHSKKSNMERITVSQGEIQDAMKHRVHRNKKKYYKKVKHKNKSDEKKKSVEETLPYFVECYVVYYLWHHYIQCCSLTHN